MKVLYLWNTAGVFTPVADWLNTYGPNEAKIVARYAFDIYRHTQDSPAGIMVDTSRDFMKMGIKLIRDWKPDIIHVSGTLKMLVLARLFAPRGLIVFTYHGSDARNPKKKAHGETKLADFVHVSTPDLHPYGTFIDRPLPDTFYDRGGRKEGTALMFYKSHFYKDKRDLARDWCKTKGYTLTILDEDHSDFPIPNDQMPDIFSKYEYFLDWKDQKGELMALSKTALEALACGCKVVHDSDLEHVFQESDIDWVTPVTYYDLYLTLRKSRFRFMKRIPRLCWYLAKIVKGRLFR